MAKKHILVAVTGGIAAYKACDVVSQLTKKDYEVQVILTEHATQFVSPLSFEALSHRPVMTTLFEEHPVDPIAHITLAKWADLICMVPATANAIAKVVHGFGDDLVSTTFLAATCNKLICPAMNVHMYENPVTQRNLALAKELGYSILEPVVGHLACNDTGKGKLASVDTIVSKIDSMIKTPNYLQGKHVLVSAGPTQEALDPVRFITNHSSGKQGYAIAQAALDLGAKVTLVSGPCSLPAPQNVELIKVTSCQDMFNAMKAHQEAADYIIMSAAVSDYRPEIVHSQKMKKSEDTLSLRFVKNPDILLDLGQTKREGQILCGFAMETQDLKANAQKKLIHKNCDLLVANHLLTKGAGFQGDTNVVTLFQKDGTITSYPLASKIEVAHTILKTMHEIEEGKSSC